MKEKKVRLTMWGGFHKVSSITVLVPEYSARCLREGYETLQGVMTPYQLRRVQKHFCGMAECRCGGIHRGVEWEIG